MNAKLGVEEASGSKPYVVRIYAAGTKIYKGPGSSYKIVGPVSPGVYTIVEEADGTGAARWGKLKSGSGWIPLDCAVKL